MADRPAGRRTFGPVVLVAALAGGALAMAGTQPWFPVEAADCDVTCLGPGSGDVGVVPSANALALVTLACLGVVLVTRGLFRRVVAVVGLLAAAGGVVSVALASFRVPQDVQDAAAQYGTDAPDMAGTGWFWIGAVASVLGLLAWVAAVRFVGRWPEMGRRYDAPADGPSDAASDTPSDGLPQDLWKALDQGHDPTS